MAAPALLLSVVVPIYNEEESIPALYERLTHELTALDAALVCQARKIIGYKIAAYDGVSDWARQLQAKEVGKTLDKSLKAEKEIAGDFDALTAACNSEAAKQAEETARKPIVRTPKRPKEFAEGARWGEW